MISETWFDTTGEQLLHDFFRSVDRVYTAGIRAGLTPQVNVDELLRAYRGDQSAGITEERGKQIRSMRERGTSYSEIGEALGINRQNVYSFLKGVRYESEKRPVSGSTVENT